MYKIYGDINSGNCYKIRLLADLLELPYEWIHIDILKGESRTPEFLAKNLNGKIPLLEIEPGKFLAESNAILNYLSNDTKYSFEDAYLQAQVLQWQFFEQYSHEPFIATSRYIIQYLGKPDNLLSELERRVEPGQKALNTMNQHLENNEFFVGDRYSIADITLYAYTHVANEGEFDLNDYRHILRWFKSMKAQPGHKDMADYL